jgi:hypothetical protein
VGYVMGVEEEGGLPDGDKVFEEAFGCVYESGVGKGIEGAAETNFVAGESLFGCQIGGGKKRKGGGT